MDGEPGNSKYVIVLSLCGSQLPQLMADNYFLGCTEPPHPQKVLRSTLEKMHGP